MFEIVSLLSKYFFVIVIYLFIFGIMRMIYLDIRSINASGKKPLGKVPYLKLINLREKLNFKIEEAYALDGNITVGRSDSNNIFIRDSFVSSIHARFFSKDDGYFLEDLKSKNGTFLNARQLKPGEVTSLRDGDKIRIGSIEFLFIKNT